MGRQLYFSEDMVKAYKESKKELRELGEKVLKDAEKALEIEVLAEEQVSYSGDCKKYENQHEYYRAASVPFMKNMLLLGYGYYFTEDNAYFEKARELMLTYAGYKKWHGKGWHGKSELQNANFCIGMSYGYDLFYDRLSKEERRIIAEATYEKGIRPGMEDWILPGSKIHCLDTMGHNWWLVCVSAAGLAATVMQEEIPENRKFAEMAARATEKWFSYAGNELNAKPVNWDDGGGYESVSYFEYPLREYLRFRRAYQKLIGKMPFNDTEYLTRASEFFCQTFYPSDEKDYYVRFGDTDGEGLMECALYMLGEGLELPHLRWYVKKCTHRSPGLLDLIFYSEIYEKESFPPEENYVFYKKNGWVIFRDKFKENAVMLTIKCGDTWNHAHADNGHFEFYRNGKPQIYDSGTCYYGAPEYLDYYVTSRAHNVLLFNGKGQDARDFLTHCRLKGKICSFLAEEGFRYAAADATGPMSRYFRKHIRHLLWLDEMILIYDDVECYEEGEVSFLLHAEQDCGFHMLTACRKSKQKGYRDRIKMRRDDYSKIDYCDPGMENEDEYDIYTQKTDDQLLVKFISVICFDSQKKVILKKIRDGYIVLYDQKKIYINELSDGRIMHKNCIFSEDGYITDAIILVEDGEKIGAINASMIRKDGKSIFDELERRNGWLGKIGG